MSNRIILNETSYFGSGSRKELLQEIKKRNYNKLLLVTDKKLIETGVVELVTSELDKEKVNYVIYDNVIPNPTVNTVKDGLLIAQINNIDAIISVGGGSSIDTAKAIGIIMTNPEFNDVISLDGLAETKNKALPIIALPTTAGTAAEVTINYVITDESRTKKMVCVDVHDIPVIAIIDPDLMQHMPQTLAASTGMDALTHAMEGYITKNSWLMTDMFHINAISLIYKNLVKSVNNKEKEAIEKIAYAQYIAGMGFSNAGLGITHSMAHSLGAYFDTPHGIANAILLPHVMKFNGKVCPGLFKNMGNAMGLDMSKVTDYEAVDKIVDAIKKLLIELNLPKTLEEVGIPEEMLPTLADQALKDICTPGNPRSVTKEDILNIYKESYK